MPFVAARFGLLLLLWGILVSGKTQSFAVQPGEDRLRYRVLLADSLQCMSLAPDGQSGLLGAGSSVYWIDLQAGALLRQYDLKLAAGDTAGVQSLDFLLDGSGFALATQTALMVMDTTGNLRWQVAGHPGGGADFVRASYESVVSADGQEGRVRFWDLETGEMGPFLFAGLEGITDCYASPDGAYLILGGKTGFGSFAVSGRGILWRNREGTYNGAAAFSPVDEHLAAFGRHTPDEGLFVALFPLELGRKRMAPVPGCPADGIVWSPDGRVLFTGSNKPGCPLYSWNWQDRKPQPKPWLEGVTLSHRVARPMQVGGKGIYLLVATPDGNLSVYRFVR